MTANQFIIVNIIANKIVINKSTSVDADITNIIINYMFQ